MFDLKNKSILVTGGSSGIGRSTAILVSQLGGSCIILGRNKNELNATLQKMNANGTHHILPFDLSKPEKFNELFDSLASFGNKIDGVVHCAGVSITEPLRFISTESVNKIIDMNVKSTIHLISGLRKRRMFNSGASIVLLASIAALIGEPGISVYAASKGAIISLAKSLAAELVSPDRIRVNCLIPAVVRTELIVEKFKDFSEEAIASLEKKHPLGFGCPDDIANAAAFFLSNATRWITGSCLIIDGGRSLGVG